MILLSSSLEAKADSSVVYQKKAFEHLNNNNVEEAVKDFNTSLQFDKENIGSNASLGDIKFNEGDFLGSIPYYEMVIYLNAEYGLHLDLDSESGIQPIRARLGFAYLKKGDIKSSFYTLKEAVELNPIGSSFYKELLPAYSKSAKAYETFLLEKDDLKSLKELSKLYFISGEFTKSLNAANEAKEAGAKQSYVLGVNGLIELQLANFAYEEGIDDKGSNSNAISLLKEAYDLGNNDKEVVLGLAASYSNDKQYKKALEVLNNNKYSDDAHFQYLLGLTNFGLNNLNDANNAFTKASELKPEVPLYRESPNLIHSR